MSNTLDRSDLEMNLLDLLWQNGLIVSDVNGGTFYLVSCNTQGRATDNYHLSKDGEISTSLPIVYYTDTFEDALYWAVRALSVLAAHNWNPVIISEWVKSAARDIMRGVYPQREHVKAITDYKSPD